MKCRACSTISSFSSLPSFFQAIKSQLKHMICFYHNCSICNNCGILHIKVLDVQDKLPKNNNARRNGSLPFNFLLQEMDLWSLYWWADTKRKQQFPWNKRKDFVWSLVQKQSCTFSQVIISRFHLKFMSIFVRYTKVLWYADVHL